MGVSRTTATLTGNHPVDDHVDPVDWARILDVVSPAIVDLPKLPFPHRLATPANKESDAVMRHQRNVNPVGMRETEIAIHMRGNDPSGREAREHHADRVRLLDAFRRPIVHRQRLVVAPNEFEYRHDEFAQGSKHGVRGRLRMPKIRVEQQRYRPRVLVRLELSLPPVVAIPFLFLDREDTPAQRACIRRAEIPKISLEIHGVSTHIAMSYRRRPPLLRLGASGLPQ